MSLTGDLLLTVFLIALSIVAFLGWMMWRHYSEHRAAALQYEGHSLVPPPSYVCPTCRRRSYSRRAVEQQFCPSCDSAKG